MELKTNYQYTYFIHPFITKNGKHNKYIQKMHKDKRFKFKKFEKEKDLELYKYFLPKIRELQNSCSIFEYIPKEDIQAKIDTQKGIFFTIPKVDIVCFNTGICFLIIKTTITDYQNFANILNFNYKFRDINQETDALNSYDNIRLQTSSFADIETFREFIKEITGSDIEAIKLNMDATRFLTYSYVCIDQEAWGPNNDFETIKHDFIKYINVLPADNSGLFEEKELKIFEKWKYAKMGLNKLGISLFSSNADINNFCTLPNEYENQYLYTYIINLYKKILLKKIEQEFNHKRKVKKAGKKFANFTKNLWAQEITEDVAGTEINHKISQTLELEKLYKEVNNKYNILYKDLNIEKSKKTTIVIAIMLAISLICNIINFIALIGK